MASPTTGDVVEKIGGTAGDIVKKGIAQLADDLDPNSIEGTLANIDELANIAIDKGTAILGDYIDAGTDLAISAAKGLSGPKISAGFNRGWYKIF